MAAHNISEKMEAIQSEMNSSIELLRSEVRSSISDLRWMVGIFAAAVVAMTATVFAGTVSIFFRG